MRILDELKKDVKYVSDLEGFLDIGQSNASQHLSILRRYGLSDYHMDGRLRCYYLVEPIIPDLLEVLKRDYAEQLHPPACCPVTKRER